MVSQQGKLHWEKWIRLTIECISMTSHTVSIGQRFARANTARSILVTYCLWFSLHSSHWFNVTSAKLSQLEEHYLAVQNILLNLALGCILARHCRHKRGDRKDLLSYCTDRETEADKVTWVAQDHRAGQGKCSDTEESSEITWGTYSKSINYTEIPSA